MIISPYPGATPVLWAVAFTAGCLVYPFWMICLTNLIEFKSNTVKNLLRVMACVSFLLSLLCVFSGDVTFLYSLFGNQFSYTNNLVFNVLIVYSFLVIAALVVIHLKWYRQTDLKRIRRQVLTIILIALAINPAIVTIEFILPVYTNIYITPVAPLLLFPLSFFIFHSMRKFKLFGITVSNVSEDMFTSLTRPVFVLDDKNKVVLENEAAVRFMGTSAIGDSFSIYLLVDVMAPEPDFLDNSFVSENVLIKTAAGAKNCDMTLTVDSDIYGDAICKIIVLRDMTDIKEMEKKLRKALREAIDASNIKSDFLAKMSHEIRTPMNAIIGMAELVLRDDITNNTREQITTIRHASSNLLSIIDDLLDFSIIESGNMQIQPVSYSLPSLIHDVSNIIRTKVSGTLVKYVVNIDSRLPYSLIGDVARIRQVLINILGNAVKHTHEGHISLTVIGVPGVSALDLLFMIEDTGSGIKKEHIDSLFAEYYQVHSGTDGVGLGLAITHGLVSVMGGNISVESEPGKGTIFTITIPQKMETPGKLANVENPLDKKSLIYEYHEIMAVSLYYAIDSLGIRCDIAENYDTFCERMHKDTYNYVFVSKALFEEHKTTILRLCANSRIVLLSEFCESAPIGNWSNITLPANVVNVANVFNSVTDPHTLSHGYEHHVVFSAPGARVMVVDDISTNLIVIAGLLEPYYMSVELCLSGAEALEKVQAGQYDLVFMDYRMPDMDGVETTERIRDLDRDNPYYSKLPIIALTADAVAGRKEMFLKCGFNDFMSKPIDADKLNSVLERWIPLDKQISSGIIRSNLTPPAAATEISESIPGIDVHQGIRLSGGTIEYFYETLASYHSDISERLDILRDCVDAKDLQKYITIVHAIKSASANIGAGDVSGAAFALENAGLNEDWDFITGNNEKFITFLEKMLKDIGEALLRYDAKNAVDGGDDGSGRDTRIQNELVNLKSALDIIDIDAINIAVESLLRLARTEDEKKTVRDISQHVLMFEYDEVHELIDSF